MKLIERTRWIRYWSHFLWACAGISFQNSKRNRKCGN